MQITIFLPPGPNLQRLYLLDAQARALRDNLHIDALCKEILGISLSSNYLKDTNQAKATKGTNDIWSNLYIWMMSSNYAYCNGTNILKKSSYDYSSLFGFVNGNSSSETAFSVVLGNGLKMYGKTDSTPITFTTEGSTYGFDASTSKGMAFYYDPSGRLRRRLCFGNFWSSSDALAPYVKTDEDTFRFKMYPASYTEPSDW